MPQIDGRYPFNSFDSMTADRALLMRQCTARQTERGRLHGPLTRIPHSYRYQVIETGLANAMFLSAVHDRLLPPPTTTMGDVAGPKEPLSRTTPACPPPGRLGVRSPAQCLARTFVTWFVSVYVLV